MREMTVARYTQLGLLVIAIVITALDPSFGRRIFALSMLTGALVGSAMTNGGLGGTLGGATAGIAFSAYVLTQLTESASG